MLRKGPDSLHEIERQEAARTHDRHEARHYIAAGSPPFRKPQRSATGLKVSAQERLALEMFMATRANRRQQAST